MIDLIQETEATPASYPAVEPRWQGDGLIGDPFDQDPGAEQVWQRIESYTRTRYTAREVVWIIKGDSCAHWTPPLSPVTSLTAERWTDSGWTVQALPDGPLGYILPLDGAYRITAQVGSGDVPAAIAEAFKRLHEYARGIAEAFKADQAFITYAETQTVMRWPARALQLSGAADVLRPYRRLK